MAVQSPDLPLRANGLAITKPLEAHELSDGEGPVMVQIVLADITEQHRRQEEQREFAARLLAVQEDERARLARELHDEPLQHLTYLARTLDDLGDRSPSSGRLSGRLAHTAAVATDAAGSLRKIIQGLRPPVLDDFGLVSALRQLTEETRSRSTTTVTFEVSGPPARVDPDVELAAYRLAQEALSNVVRHAHADRATVSLAFAPAHVRLTIEDDGVGIGPLSQTPGPSGGLGLIGMRERVGMTGGRLDISSRDPHGTRVHIVMPLRAAPGEDRGAHPSRPSPRPPWAGSQLSGIRPSRR
ncbi:sensor histidine kinase [Intrasporangium calvum]|uniref:histidine kinase n=1 Tax=Intrasporangium calvum TaxID=53358 RepID=A0ABT5GGV5_9MICO|nr:sensor histidine kinase [Intrasporangium calvum]MDC5697461.1 sensor histidine kinase [Intrasporangium calvum]